MKKKSPNDAHTNPQRTRGRGRRLFWILVFGAALLALAAHARGFGHDRGRADRRHVGFGSPAAGEALAERVDRLVDHLDATDVQRVRIAALVEARSGELEELASSREALREEVTAALTAEELTPARRESLRSGIVELSAEATRQTLDLTFEIAAELTPEQRSELIEHWAGR